MKSSLWSTSWNATTPLATMNWRTSAPLSTRSLARRILALSIAGTVIRPTLWRTNRSPVLAPAPRHHHTILSRMLNNFPTHSTKIHHQQTNTSQNTTTQRRVPRKIIQPVAPNTKMASHIQQRQKDIGNIPILIRDIMIISLIQIPVRVLNIGNDPVPPKTKPTKILTLIWEISRHPHKQTTSTVTVQNISALRIRTNLLMNQKYL